MPDCVWSGILGENVAKKKKKMTPAQAAAARRDTTKRERTTVSIKDNGPVDRGNRLIVGITVAMVVLIAIISFGYAFFPLGFNG